jgi:hypothetical protein
MKLHFNWFSQKISFPLYDDGEINHCKVDTFRLEINIKNDVKIGCQFD